MTERMTYYEFLDLMVERGTMTKERADYDRKRHDMWGNQLMALGGTEKGTGKLYSVSGTPLASTTDKPTSDA